MINKSSSNDVPVDFPHAEIHGSISGVTSKLLLVQTASGGYSVPRISEEERILRWMNCEDLAKQLADAALRSKFGKRSDWREEDILEQYIPRLRNTGWVSDDELTWLVKRAAEILNWPLPLSLIDSWGIDSCNSDN